jgi:T5SS/PEP-CTERM-associated repeat protein
MRAYAPKDNMMPTGRFFCSRRAPASYLRARSLLLMLAAVMARPAAQAEKVWMSTMGGRWQDGTNWSGRTAPDISSFIKITNEFSKTVIVDSGTPATNLTVQSLSITAPPGATNTILLSSLGLTNPLVLQAGLELLDGALLRITNSALQTLLTNDHVNLDGNLVLDSGSIDFGDTTVTARVGRVTSGTFEINDGIVYAGTITVGGLTNSSGLLNMNGGVLNIASLLSVGRNSGTTGTVAVLGGQMIVSSNDTRIGDEGFGLMMVSNAMCTLNNLQVGRDGAGGLEVQPGASIHVLLDMEVGLFPGSFGTVLISGGQLLCESQKVFVGQGGDGQLGISSGSLTAGAVLVAGDSTNSIGASGNVALSGGSIILNSNFVVGSAAYSTGQVAIAGGELVVTNAGGSGVVRVDSGGILLSGGSLVTDLMVATNSGGQLVFHSGTLETKNTIMANNTPFVVGDGTSSAVLMLRGGTHSFANGLIISSNATLAGCGTIVGTVINYGTILTNCAGGTPPAIAMTLESNRATDAISFLSSTGSTYTLQYKNYLSDPSWADLPPATNGTGRTIVLRDPTPAGSPSRFYRLKIQ